MYMYVFRTEENNKKTPYSGKNGENKCNSRKMEKLTAFSADSRKSLVFEWVLDVHMDLKKAKIGVVPRAERTTPSRWSEEDFSPTMVGHVRTHETNEAWSRTSEVHRFDV
jgi:hypothetical protein